MKIQGSVEIRVRDSRTDEIKQVIKQNNLITNYGLQRLLDWEVQSRGRTWNDYYDGSRSGYETQISISTSTAEPSIFQPILTNIIATGYIPSGITSPIWNESTNPPFGQIQNRIDWTGSARTFNCVGLTSAYVSNSQNISASALAYLKLDIPCVQGAYDYLDIFYRIQFFNTEGKNFTRRALLDFGGRVFDKKRWRMYDLFISACKCPTEYFPYKDLSTSRWGYYDHEMYDYYISSFPSSQRYEYEWDGGANIGELFKFKYIKTWELGEAVGGIFNSLLQGRSNDSDCIYTYKPFVNKSSPFQNLFSHSSNATKPFFDSLALASGNGKVILGGTWNKAWAEMYKITITGGGDVGSSTYKFSVRKHLGFNGNTWSDRSIGCHFRNANTPAFDNCHGWRDENNDVLRWSNTQIVQYDDTGVTLLNVFDGSYKNWDANTTPALPVNRVRQCAVDPVNQKIYVGCRQTGLWAIDVANNVITQPLTNPCYGVDVGRSQVAYALIEGGLYRSSDWTVPLDFKRIGITDGNWKQVYFLKIDPENIEDQMAFVIASAGEDNKIIWYKGNYTPPPAPPATKYWRIKNTNVATGPDKGWYPYEIIFRDNSAAELTIGGSASASRNSDSAGLAFDKNNNSYWNGGANIPVGSWVQYTTANPCIVSAVNIINLNNGFNVPPTNYDIEYSINGNDWILAWSFTVGTTDRQYYNFIAPYYTGAFSGPQSNGIKPFPASLDVSDSGGFWATSFINQPYHGYERLTFGSSNYTSYVDSNIYGLCYKGINSPIYGNHVFYKISFYNNNLIGRSRILDILGNVVNTYAGVHYYHDRSFIIHLEKGICLSSRDIRQLFTDNTFCWDNYGWNGSSWELNHAGAKVTHALDLPLLDSLTIRFQNSPNAPQFVATDYYTQAMCHGLLKDNATTVYHDSAWYSKPAQFDYPVQAGFLVPANPTNAVPTPVRYWRLKVEERIPGYRWYIRRLIFKDSNGNDLTPQGGGVASASYNSGDAYEGFDTNNGSLWDGPERGMTNQFIQYTFSSPVLVSSISINHYVPNGDYLPPTFFSMEWSENGVRWNASSVFRISGTNDSVYYNASPTYNSLYEASLSARSDNSFVAIDTDGAGLTNFMLDGLPVATIYYNNGAIPPGPNEVVLWQDGRVRFNAADSGKTLTGYYCWIKN